MSKENKNPFTDLVNHLTDGTLGHKHIQIAYREWVRRRDDIPDAIKSILSGTGDDYAGLLYHMFSIMNQTIGGFELAWRRGYQAGWEEAKEEVNNG